jgi:hypothetical protein
MHRQGSNYDFFVYLSFFDNDTDKLKINLVARQNAIDRIGNRNDLFGATDKFGKE